MIFNLELQWISIFLRKGFALRIRQNIFFAEIGCNALGKEKSDFLKVTAGGAKQLPNLRNFYETQIYIIC